MAEEKELRLKVGELTAREEAGRGIVRLDSSAMQKLGVKEGDVLEIEGTKRTAAIAVRAYPADVGLNIIRMDGITRRNCGSGVGEFVKIRKADVKEARRVALAPAERGLMIHISPNLVKQNIYMRPMVKGDIIIPSPVVRRKRQTGNFLEEFFGMDFEEMFFTPFPGETRFIVTNTDPSGIVRVGDITEIEILPEAPEKLEERAIPTVTYEDVGGIREVVTKVREMIELPLRHPELFERLGIDAPKGVLLYGPPGCGKTLLAKAVANESGANFISISGPEIFSKWYGQSLSGDSLVPILENGQFKRISIKEIVRQNKKNIKVLAFDDKGKVKWSNVTGLFEHKNRCKLFEIKTRTGRKIVVTDDHSLFTLNGTKIETIKTSQLVPKKSYIAVARKIPLPDNLVEEFNFLEALNKNDYNLKVEDVSVLLEQAKEKLGTEKILKILNVSQPTLNRYIKTGRIRASKFLRLMNEAKITFDPRKLKICSVNKKFLPAMIRLDKNFCTFLGLWVAEGSYGLNTVNISINKNEKEIIKPLLIKLFGHVSESQKCNAIDFKIVSKPLFVLLKYGLKMEDGAKNKKIPEIIFNLNKKLIAAFLRGYFSGDGSIYKNQKGVLTIEATTESQQLASDLMHLLLVFEIIAKNIERKRKGTQNRVYFQGFEPLKRFREIGFLYKEKNHLIKNYLQQVKWIRSEQIPMTTPIKGLLTQIPEAYQWIRVGSATIGRGILTDFVNPEAMVEYGLDIRTMNEVNKLITNDIYWDRVEEIKEVKNEEYVYDLSVSPNENFLAGFGGIFAHNTEENLRKIFEEAEKTAPSIIFIDEIDAIAPKREEVTGEVERRTVSQLLTLMDGLKSRGKVIVIAATNRPNALDPALRRAGRFDREIEIPVPDRNGRLEIFKIHTRNMPLDKSVDLNWLADITYGYVGADIMALCKEAAMSALRRVLPEIKWKEEAELPKEVTEKLVVKKEDFENALKIVEPSAMREVLVEVPKVKWEDIGGLDEVKQQLKEMVEWPLKNPESFKRLGIEPPKGILLYGPPGCGKTLLAKAVANESGANFIAVKGPEVLTMWVGESERKIRELFRRARQVAPSIIFLDEIDALAPRRGLYRGSAVTETVVSQLLTEMSGIEETKGVTIIAATNRPDIVDPALLRPGRIDRFVLVPAPDEKTRLEILKIHTKNMPLKNVDLKELARRTEGFSGADLEALAREAAMNALRENLKAKEVSKKHFEEAFKKITPSLTKDVITHYQKFEERARKIKKIEEEKEPGYIG